MPHQASTKSGSIVVEEKQKKTVLDISSSILGSTICSFSWIANISSTHKIKIHSCSLCVKPVATSYIFFFLMQSFSAETIIIIANCFPFNSQYFYSSLVNCFLAWIFSKSYWVTRRTVSQNDRFIDISTVKYISFVF